MPRYSKISRSKSIHEASIASSLLDFLAPPTLYRGFGAQYGARLASGLSGGSKLPANEEFECLFYSALSKASLCAAHRGPRPLLSRPCSLHNHQRRQISTTQVRKNAVSGGLTSTHHGRKPDPRSMHNSTDTKQSTQNATQAERVISTQRANSSPKQKDPILHAFEEMVGEQDKNRSQVTANGTASPKGARTAIEGSRLPVEFFTDLNNLKRVLSPLDDYKMQPWVTKKAPRPKGEARAKTRPTSAISHFFWQRRQYHSNTAVTDTRQKRFSEGSHLPPNFFDDISSLKSLLDTLQTGQSSSPRGTRVAKIQHQPRRGQNSGSETATSIEDQLRLLKSVRELEEKLLKAKKDLSKSMADVASSLQTPVDPVGEKDKQRHPILLTKEDYMNLVDLYYYSHNNRFSPESTDASPTPLVLDDYSFALSSDFSKGAEPNTVNEDEDYESPLKHIDEMLRKRQLREIAVMQVFIDLLLDDYSSNRALFEAYKQLPDPGVTYLPKGALRLFMQRMSTPWTLSETSMLRYLSLIDDMQKANMPITTAEWSSAIYLAGRAFNKVTGEEVANAFEIWRTMEKEAGVEASHVTFNILFDIAVRAGKFALGETVLKEMHSRNLRLNRLGRVSLMYYHGLRKDGDGVRKAYRDFVEAGEIVDTLVLNCVIASLLNAQEPQAADQIYARMKDMHSRIRNGLDREGNETFYRRYPSPEANVIDHEMASTHLGRILEKAPHLQSILPENHRRLQASMPLTPDHVTFRSMIAYHVTTSGDLDRLSVLLNEMTEFFHIPLQTITFQHLFKGFALHGPLGGPETVWSVKRLDMCWNACRAAIKASVSYKKMNIPKGAEFGAATTLPSMTQINRLPEHAPLPNVSPPLSRPPPRRVSDWSEFVLDLAAFPRERLKLLERFHATMFDAEGVTQPHEKPGIHTWSSPFFQSTVYTAPEPSLDVEEGEYVLPSPSRVGVVHCDASAATWESTSDTDELVSTSDREGEQDGVPHRVSTNRMIVCWLLRAYARTTKSRARVEEVWGQVRKLYNPRDATDRESVVRVLQRCLRDCDREGRG